ncbi:anti-sigma factor domain-containing protein [Clostridium sp. B9]|uniref:anti-sigma factor domain-containing protein n=1 Tax=Clostridium sp. B9 TaxID=3423224 RepID=UPI003D2F3F87
MSEVTFRRDKYIFSSRNIKKNLDKAALKKEISVFLKELRSFKVDIKNLTSEFYNIEERNLILNIAYYLVDEEVLLRKILNRRELSTKVIAKKTGFSNEKIVKWSDYIIAYMILLYSADYTNLATYLNITFKDLEALAVIKGSNGEEVIYKGLVIKEGKKSTIIMTKDGQFVRIKTRCEDKVGEELSGKEKKTLKHYRKIIVSTILILAVLIGGYTYIYKQQETTILIQGTSKVKLGLNRFDRVVYSYSPTEKGRILVTELDLDNYKFEEGMIAVLKGFEKEEMMPPNRVVNVYITGEMVDTVDLNKVMEYVDQVNNDKIPTNNFKIKINNSGYEKKNN